MDKITDYELEQILYKMKANINSKTLKENQLMLCEKDPEIKSLDQYIIRLQRGEVMVNLPELQNSFENYVMTKMTLSEVEDTNLESSEELGNKDRSVYVFEPENVAKNRKKEAYRSEIEEAELSPEELEEKEKKKDRLSEYSIITLKDKDGKNFELVIDKNGFDVGIITYDEKGKPSFEMAPDVKASIDEMIEESNIKSFMTNDMKKLNDVLEKEFYIQDIDALVRAIEEDILIPKDTNQAGKRAIIAEAIIEGKSKSDFNEYEKKYFEDDNIKTLLKTAEEKEIEAKIEAQVEARMKEDEESKVKQRDLAQEQKEKQHDEENTEERVLRAEPKAMRNKLSDDKKNNDVNSVIPEEEKGKIKDICNKNDVNLSSVRAVFIVMDPSCLADATEGSDINRNGNEVTVIQFSGEMGRDRYLMVQDEIVRGGVEHDEAFRKRIAQYHMTIGKIKRAEDNETTYDFTDSTGKSYRIKLDSENFDMSENKKMEFINQLSDLMKQLEKCRSELGKVKEIYNKEPEIRNTLVAQINTKINSINGQVYQLFVNYDVRVFDVVEQEVESQEPEIEEDVEQETEKPEPEIQENVEKEEDESQGYDPRDSNYKRANRYDIS